MTDAEQTPTPASDADAAPDAAPEAAAETETPGVHETQEEVEVGLVRAPRYGRIIVSFGVLGGIVAALASLFFPVAEDAEYTLGQIAGLMLVVGGIVGITVGAILSLILGVVARRNHGAAIAVHTDVG